MSFSIQGATGCSPEEEEEEEAPVISLLRMRFLRVTLLSPHA